MRKLILVALCLVSGTVSGAPIDYLRTDGVGGMAAALTMAALTSDPITATNGDVYYNTTDDEFRCRAAGVWEECGPDVDLSPFIRHDGTVAMTGAMVFASLASDPSGVNGAIYYNTTSGKFRCHEAGSWADCRSAAGTVTGTGTTGTLAKFSGTSTIADSIVTESGSAVVVAGTVGVNSGVAADLTLSEATVDRTAATDLLLTFGNSGAGALNVAFQDGFSVDTNTLCLDPTLNRVGFGTCFPAATVDIVGAVVVSGATSLNDTVTLAHAAGSAATPAFTITKAAGTGLERYARFISMENGTAFPMDLTAGSSATSLVAHSVVGYTGTTTPNASVPGLVLSGVLPLTAGSGTAAAALRLDCFRSTSGTGAGDGVNGTIGAVTSGPCINFTNAGLTRLGMDFAGKFTATPVSGFTGAAHTVSVGGTQGGALAGFSVDYSTLGTIDNNIWALTTTLPGAFTHSTSGTAPYVGIQIGWEAGTITNTAGTFVASGLDVLLPNITQTAGTITAHGARVTIPPATAMTTGGVMTGYDLVAPTTSGPSAGTLYGFRARGITSPGAATEIAFDVGTGWELGFQSPVPVAFSASQNTGGCSLSSGQCTVSPVRGSANCQCSPVGTTAAIAAQGCSVDVSGTTLTITSGTGGGTAKYWCSGI